MCYPFAQPAGIGYMTWVAPPALTGTAISLMATVTWVVGKAVKSLSWYYDVFNPDEFNDNEDDHDHDDHDPSHYRWVHFSLDCWTTSLGHVRCFSWFVVFILVILVRCFSWWPPINIAFLSLAPMELYTSQPWAPSWLIHCSVYFQILTYSQTHHGVHFIKRVQFIPKESNSVLNFRLKTTSPWTLIKFTQNSIMQTNQLSKRKNIIWNEKKMGGLGLFQIGGGWTLYCRRHLLDPLPQSP